MLDSDESMNKQLTVYNRPLKRVYIKEELVAITGFHRTAMILDFFMDSCSAWTRITAKTIKSETLLNNVCENSILSYVAKLVSLGFIERRKNPHDKFDKVYQYKTNYDAIKKAMSNKGY